MTVIIDLGGLEVFYSMYIATRGGRFGPQLKILFLVQLFLVDSK
jgi:hypothetical protein